MPVIPSRNIKRKADDDLESLLAKETGDVMEDDDTSLWQSTDEDAVAYLQKARMWSVFCEIEMPK